MSLTVILQTRGRPDFLRETIRRTLPNMVRSDTRLLLTLDADDTPSLDALDTMPFDERMIVSVKPREDSRGEKYDRALTEAPADLYLMAVDYAPILTPGFDQIMLDAAKVFPDGIGCVYTRMANASFPVYQAITRKMVEKIGYIYNHEYPFWFIDHELDDIARMIGRYICVPVNADNTGPSPGKTQRMRELKFWTTYFDAATLYRRNLARSIIDAPDFIAPEWMKEILRNSYQPIEARSMWINHSVRADAANIEATRGLGGEPDAGYLRLKAKAEKKILDMFGELEREAALAA